MRSTVAFAFVTRQRPDRPAIPARSESELVNDGARGLLANKGYKRSSKAGKDAIKVGHDKAREEKRFDGK